MRPSQRSTDELRPIKLTRDYTRYAEGSVLVEYGHTKVLCNATVTPGIPRWLRDSGQGWITAEYGMIPRATHDRTNRESSRGKQTGRTLEIQRLIGRSLRACVDMTLLGDNTITIDCDVLQADGGTRTASITGGCVALHDAIAKLAKKNKKAKEAFYQFVASVSVGVYKNETILDLDYDEDSNAQVDMNLIMTEHDEYIEIQGTGEERSFTDNEFRSMMTFGRKGIKQIITIQKEALGIAEVVA